MGKKLRQRSEHLTKEQSRQCVMNGVFKGSSGSLCWARGMHRGLRKARGWEVEAVGSERTTCLVYQQETERVREKEEYNKTWGGGRDRVTASM